MSNKQKMIEKLGSEEAYREHMRDIAKKSGRNKGRKGGFAYMKINNPERLKEMGRKYGRTKGE